MSRQTPPLSRPLRPLTLSSPFFFFLEGVHGFCFPFSLRVTLWSLLAFDCKRPPCNPRGPGENGESEVFYVPGRRPYEVLTVFCSDICSAFPIESGRGTGAACLTGAGSAGTAFEIKLRR